MEYNSIDSPCLLFWYCGVLHLVISHTGFIGRGKNIQLFINITVMLHAVISCFQTNTVVCFGPTDHPPRYLPFPTAPSDKVMMTMML